MDNIIDLIITQVGITHIHYFRKEKKMKNLGILILLIFLFTGCNNYIAAWRIKYNYSKEYNGVDTLIRTDGYYYEKCIPDVCMPTVFLPDGSFFRIGARFLGLSVVEATIKERGMTKNARGNFFIRGDTLIAQSVVEYQITCYDLYETYYVIEDSITLRMVKGIYNDGQMTRTTIYNTEYTFRPFPDIARYSKR